MKHYLNEATGDIHAFNADDSQDYLIYEYTEDGERGKLLPGWKKLTKDEFKALNDPPEAAVKRQTQAAKDALDKIDIKSIRALREYVAAQPLAPAQIKTLEAEAIAERLKIK